MTRTTRSRFRPRARALEASLAVAVVALAVARCAPEASPGARSAVEQVTVTLTEGTNMAAAAAPDGQTLVLALQGSLWRVPVGGGDAVRLTGSDVEATWPSWSPDGERIAFQRFSADGFYHVWTVAADGTDPRQVTSGPFDHREPAWSPDGGRIAFSSDRAANGSYDVWTVDLRTGAYEQHSTESPNEHSPAWSRDGSRLAYASGRSIFAVNGEGEAEELASVAAGTAQAPSWRPDGSGVVYQDNTRQIVLGGQQVTSGEDVFPFPVTWLPDGSFVYTADGHPRIRDAAGGTPRDVAFSAELVLDRPVTQRKDHRFASAEPRPARGIFSPVLSPEGENRVAFVALNDLWVMEIGQPPVQLTDDTFIEWVPSWSPDGREVYFSSDRHGGGRPDLYAIDPATRAVRRVSVTQDSRMVFPVLSPDGKSFAYIHGADQSLWVHDIASGQARRVAEQAYASNVGKPTWSPDGRTLALADIQRSNTRYREGRNLIRTVDVTTGEWTFHEPGPLPNQLSERFEAGPAWSPDGSWMAFVMNSTLHVMPVAPTGEPTGPARRITEHAADMPSWGGDSRTIVYLSNGRLRTIQVDGSGQEDITPDLTWAPAIQDGVTVIHAGGLWDGVQPVIQRDMEIRIEAGRIVEVRPIGPNAEAEARASGARFIDASGLTVMPGLWDTHVHPRVQDVTGQWWAVQLAYGLTGVVSNGASTYHTLLARESLEAGRMVGPRLFAAPIFDGPRTYYGHHRGIENEEVLALELAKARELEMDYLKAYVRSPAAHMRRIAEAAQEMGIPAGSHFLSPGIQSGLGGTTHLSATQRMGYSWSSSPAGRSYQDVTALYSQGSFHLSSSHTQTNNVLGDDAAILSDPRFLELMPPDYVAAITTQASRPPSDEQRQNIRDDVATPAAILRAGGLVTIGSDTPLAWPALGVHARLRAFAYGVGNHEALQAVTINAARYAHADHELGTVEAGKIADLILVRGDPLADVKNAANVELVLKTGVPYTVDEILRPYR